MKQRDETKRNDENVSKQRMKLYENEGISGLFIMKTNDTVRTVSISFPFLPRVAIMVSGMMQL